MIQDYFVNRLFGSRDALLYVLYCLILDIYIWSSQIIFVFPQNKPNFIVLHVAC